MAAINRMKLMNLLKKNAVPIFIVLVAVTLVLYMNYKPEGFYQRKELLNEGRCKEKMKSGAGSTRVINGKTVHRGSYTWNNGTCWAPCGHGRKMRSVDKCGSLDDRDTSGQTKRPKAYSTDPYVA